MPGLFGQRLKINKEKTMNWESCLKADPIPWLSDFGLTIDLPELDELTKKVMCHTENGCFAIRQTSPQKGEPMGKHDPRANEWHAMPCDSPLLTYTLYQLGVRHPRIEESVQKTPLLFRPVKKILDPEISLCLVQCPVSC